MDRTQLDIAQHGPEVFALALRILRSKEDAEDLTQETLFYAWRRLDREEPPPSRVSVWILAHAQARCINLLHRRSRQSGLLQILQATNDWAPARQHDILPERLHEALSALPTQQRAVIALAYFEGLSHVRIAERGGVPLGTVKARVRLALRKLARLLDTPSLLLAAIGSGPDTVGASVRPTASATQTLVERGPQGRGRSLFRAAPRCNTTRSPRTDECESAPRAPITT